jgi:predicted DNA-binding protein
MHQCILTVVTTTTIRVNRSVHERLQAISEASGRQLVDVVADATDALERIRFAEAVRIEVDALRQDPVMWAAYVAEFDGAVSDGIA